MTKSQLKELYLRDFGNYTDRAYYVDKKYSHFNAFEDMIANEEYISNHYTNEKLYIVSHYLGVRNIDIAKDTLNISKTLQRYINDAIADYTYDRLINDGLNFVRNNLATVVVDDFKETYGNIIDAFDIEVEPHSYYENKRFYISFTMKENIDKLLDMIDLSKIETAKDIYFIVKDVLQKVQKLFNIYSALVDSYVDKTNTQLDVKNIMIDYIEDRDIILKDVIAELYELMEQEQNEKKQDAIGWILSIIEETYRRNIQTDMINKYNDEAVEEITIDIPFYYGVVVFPYIKDIDLEIIKDAAYDIYLDKVYKSSTKYYTNLIDEFLDDEETKLSFYYTNLYEIRLIDYNIEQVSEDNHTLHLTYRCAIPVEQFTEAMIDSGYTFNQISEDIEEKLYHLTEDFNQYVSNRQFYGEFTISKDEVLDYIKYNGVAQIF